jgi:hypothetical protein
MQRIVPSRVFMLCSAITLLAPAPFIYSQSAPPLDIFHVKYISDGAVYLDAGRNAKLDKARLPWSTPNSAAVLPNMYGHILKKPTEHRRSSMGSSKSNTGGGRPSLCSSGGAERQLRHDT